MDKQESIQQVILKDAAGLAVGCGTAFYALFNKIVTIAQGIGVIAGTLLTLAILTERLYRWWKASKHVR